MPVIDDIRKEQEKTKDMSFKGKLSYFWYYYKVHTLVTIAIVFFLCVLIHDIVTAKDYAFSAVYINANQTFSAEDQMEAFAEYADLDTEEFDVVLDSAMYLSLTDTSEVSLSASQKLAALLSAKNLDIAVMDEEVFTNYALTETFYDLREILPEDLLEKYKDNFFYVDGTTVEAFNNKEEYSSHADDMEYYNKLAETLQKPNDPSVMENPIPVGIYVGDTTIISDAGCYSDKKPVFGIIINTPRLETAIQYLRFLDEESIAK